MKHQKPKKKSRKYSQKYNRSKRIHSKRKSKRIQSKKRIKRYSKKKRMSRKFLGGMVGRRAEHAGSNEFTTRPPGSVNAQASAPAPGPMVGKLAPRPPPTPEFTTRPPGSMNAQASAPAPGPTSKPFDNQAQWRKNPDYGGRASPDGTDVEEVLSSSIIMRNVKFESSVLGRNHGVGFFSWEKDGDEFFLHFKVLSGEKGTLHRLRINFAAINSVTEEGKNVVIRINNDHNLQVWKFTDYYDAIGGWINYEKAPSERVEGHSYGKTLYFACENPTLLVAKLNILKENLKSVQKTSGDTQPEPGLVRDSKPASPRVTEGVPPMGDTQPEPERVSDSKEASPQVTEGDTQPEPERVSDSKAASSQSLRHSQPNLQGDLDRVREARTRRSPLSTSFGREPEPERVSDSKAASSQVTAGRKQAKKLEPKLTLEDPLDQARLAAAQIQSLRHSQPNLQGDLYRVREARTRRSPLSTSFGREPEPEPEKSDGGYVPARSGNLPEGVPPS